MALKDTKIFRHCERRGCSKEFTTHLPRKRYCSFKCKDYELQRRWYVRNHVGVLHEKICACGVKFSTVIPHKKYHNPKCRPKETLPSRYVRKVFQPRHCERKGCCNFFTPRQPHQKFCKLGCAKAIRNKGRKRRRRNNTPAYRAGIKRRRKRQRTERPWLRRDTVARARYRKKNLTESQIQSMLVWVKFKRELRGLSTCQL